MLPTTTPATATSATEGATTATTRQAPLLRTCVDASGDMFEGPFIEVCYQFGGVFVVLPPKRNDGWGSLLPAELTVERRVSVAKADQGEQTLHHRGLTCSLDLARGVVMPVHVTTDASAREQLHVVGTPQQPDVVHLRHSRQIELHRTCEQVAILVAAQRIVEGAVHLI